MYTVLEGSAGNRIIYHKNENMIHTWKNGSHLKKMIHTQKMGHTWKNGSHLKE